jgi:hypothetical protein
MLRHRIGLMLAGGVALTGAGCAAPDGANDRPATVVRQLTAALAAGDGTAACAALAPRTRAALVEQSGSPCPRAIADEDLPPAGPVRTVDVYGQWARVVTTQDTVFLAAFGTDWRVVAAGCRPRGEEPYDCQVQGE